MNDFQGVLRLTLTRAAAAGPWALLCNRPLAEDVEAALQPAFLREQGCDYGENHVFARRQPTAEPTGLADPALSGAHTR